MRISVFGLGYVGIVTSACLAKAGHKIIGVEPNATKVDLINRGQSPIVEKDVESMIAEAVESGNLTATVEPHDAIMDTEISLICVGTPSKQNGDLDLTYVQRVSTEIGSTLAKKEDFHVVVVRSTMLPGSVRSVVMPALAEAAGDAAKGRFGVCINPEFLREGSAVYDYYNPPKTVIGEEDTRSGDVTARLYDGIPAPMLRTPIEVAEMIKYVDNSWHALKVVFGNEIGAICKAAGVDSHAVMDVFLQDKKLNISTAYLRPGFAFGGSCLPKDVRAINYRAKSFDIDVPLLRAVLPSNRVHIDRAIDMVVAAGNKKVSILGLSFKPGTDDLRESPVLEMSERLLGKGFDLRIFDRSVELARLMGANRDYLMNHIPHISSLLIDDLEKVLDHGDTVVIGNVSTEYAAAIRDLDASKHIIDLVRISETPIDSDSYEGIAW